MFIVALANLDGWVAWGINPINEGLGAKVIHVFKMDNIIVIKTVYLKSYINIISQK